jgi:hypothetical protein
MVIVMFGNAFMLSIMNFVLIMKLSYIDFFYGYDFVELKYVYFVILRYYVEVEYVLSTQATLFVITFVDMQQFLMRLD